MLNLLEKTSVLYYNKKEVIYMKREGNVWQEHLLDENKVYEYPECSMFSYFKKTAEPHMDYYAIEFEGKKTTYRKLISEIEKTAKALVNIGVKKGDCVSIISVNTPEVLEMIYAANRIGAIVNMIHPLLSPNDIETFIKTTNSSVVLILDQIYPKISKIQWDEIGAPRIILTRIIDSLPTHIKPVYAMMNRKKASLNPKHNCIYWKNFISDCDGKGINLPIDDGKMDDVAMIMYSGGTTGTPKGVMLTNLNINSYSIQAFEVSGIERPEGKKFLAILPLFHGFGFASGIHANLCKGVHIYLVAKFEFVKSIQLIFKKKINFIYAVPALFEALIRSPEIEGDLSFLECLICGGDKLQKRLYDKLNKYLETGNSKAVFCEGYGQTECVAACLTNPYFAINSESVGILLPDTSAKIVKIGTQDEVPNGTDGELCICGPTVMKGYYNNEKETALVLQKHNDGRVWLHTGDAFCRDDDGYFYFRQRISRMVISAGYNIYVTQVEKAITSCLAVAQCCVVGVEDKVLGHRIRAHVVLNDPAADKAVVREKILEECRNQLPEYSLPHEIRFCDSLPQTNLGKVDFKALEQEV